MNERILYVLKIPEDAQTATSSTKRRNISESSVVAGGQSTAESISLQPGEQRLTGSYRGRYAERMAAKFEELFDAGDIEEVPLYGRERQLPSDGYYVLRDVEQQPQDPRGFGEDGIYRFDGALKKTGTRNTHWRATDTTLVQVDNDFGNDTTGYIGAPAAATKVRWYDGVGTTEAVSAVATRSAEHRNVDVYDADASSFEDPALIYDVRLDEDAWVDVIVWDDHGGSKTDNDGVLQWQRVFDAGHEYSGNALISNGLLRLTFDEDVPELTAEEWDDANQTWSSVSLGTSDWEFRDLDVTHLSSARVDAQVLFENTSTSEEYALDMSLKRGYHDALWARPENESDPTPSGLQTKLDPIASTSVVDPEESKTLIPREEVRK
jgi:hypothetical protein